MKQKLVDEIVNKNSWQYQTERNSALIPSTGGGGSLSSEKVFL